MPTANENLRDSLLSHQIGLHRLTTKEIRRMVALLRPIYAATNRELRNRLLIASLRGGDPGPFTTRQAELALAAVRAILVEGYAGLGKRFQRRLDELADWEASYVGAAVRSAVPAAIRYGEFSIAPEVLHQLIRETPMQGGLVGEWFRATGKKSLVRSAMKVYKKELDAAIASGALTGQPIDKTVRQLALKINRVARRHLRAVVDTATKHATGLARQAWGESNAGKDGVVNSVVHVSTFDTNTTVEWCIPRSGKRWTLPGHKPIGHGLVFAPGASLYHWGCRSLNTFGLKSWQELGIDATELTGGEKASMDGFIPREKSLIDFYKDRQWRAGELREMFGKRRAARIESGDLSVAGALRQIGVRA